MKKERTIKMEQDNVSQKNINEKWMENIFEILMRLEGYERLAKEGCLSILDYVQNTNIDPATLQKKNYDLFITEFQVLLNNIKHIIDKNQFLRMHLELSQLLNYEGDVGGFIEVKLDMILHTENFVIKPEFYNATDKISRLRGMAVSSLWKLLSPNSKESFEGMPQ